MFTKHYMIKGLGLLFIILGFACVPEKKHTQQDSWIKLFDGNTLKGWDTYLGPPFSSEEPALGLNNDPLDVFSVVSHEWENVIRISGEIWGGISTTESFENYHLQLQFKWGEKKWPPRLDEKRDSGLLYHAGGPHGQGSGFWLKSQEFQIQEGDCGDYWGVAGAFVDIRSEYINDSIYMFNPTGDFHEFSEARGVGNYCKKFPDAENKTGEWNTLDLYSIGGTSMHVVNGVLTMVLENTRHDVEGEILPLTKGKIQLQSEAAEILYKNIRIRPIEKLPSF
jgi:hypothetical protein